MPQMLQKERHLRRLELALQLSLNPGRVSGCPLRGCSEHDLHPAAPLFDELRLTASTTVDQLKADLMLCLSLLC